ncbi:MAG: SRPBCC domain-containing protein [Gemmatimonadota bacterium]|nr:SRPBCC domain-containing protein [Gemmatimonadota bacterium]
MSEAETRVPPVERSIQVPWDPDIAFHRFTERIDEWWPLETHACDPVKAVTCAVEPRVGGRLYETTRDGEEHLWGTITAWDPPRRLAFTWHPGRPDATRQDVEITFTPERGGTRVAVFHTGWERLGENAEETREQYGPGWEFVLARYSAEC